MLHCLCMRKSNSQAILDNSGHNEGLNTHQYGYTCLYLGRGPRYGKLISQLSTNKTRWLYNHSKRKLDKRDGNLIAYAYP